MTPSQASAEDEKKDIEEYGGGKMMECEISRSNILLQSDFTMELACCCCRKMSSSVTF